MSTHPPVAVLPQMQFLAYLLSSYRLRFGTEVQLQADVGAFLLAERYAFEPEYRLTPTDRIDFYLPAQKIGIECKISGGPSSVSAQLVRYAHLKEIEGLILVTSKHTHLLGARELGCKPYIGIWIGGSGL
jgi:hypothetical protein